MKLFRRFLQLLPFDKFPVTNSERPEGPFDDLMLLAISLGGAAMTAMTTLPYIAKLADEIGAPWAWSLVALGVISVPLIWQGVLTLGHRIYRYATVPVGSRFYDHFERIEGMLDKAKDRLDTVELSASSDPGKLLATAHAAFDQARFTAGALSLEIVRHSPELSAKWEIASSKSFVQLKSVFTDAMSTPSFPLELRLEVESFFDSLEVFGSFDAAFEEAVELALKPQLKVPSAAAFAGASALLKEKFEESSLRAELDKSARDDLEAFIKERFNPTPAKEDNLEIVLKSPPEKPRRFLKARNS